MHRGGIRSLEMRVGKSMLTAQNGTPLVVRASLPRTFLGMGIFVEACLVFLGVYLLLDSWKRPLEAHQSDVIFAGVLLSLASILLFYLARPKRRDALARVDRQDRGRKFVESPLTAFGESVQSRQRAEQEMGEAERLPGPM